MSIAKNDHFDRGQILGLSGREKVMSKLHTCLSNRIMQFTLEAATEDLLKKQVTAQGSLHFLIINPYKWQKRETHRLTHSQYSEEQSCQTGVAGSPPPQHTLGVRKSHHACPLASSDSGHPFGAVNAPGECLHSLGTESPQTQKTNYWYTAPKSTS